MLVEENCSSQAVLHWTAFFIPQRSSFEKPAKIRYPAMPDGRCYLFKKTCFAEMDTE
jgi:hypothetical protein